MNTCQFNKLLAIVFAIAILFAVVPVEAAAQPALPTFEKFVKTVVNGRIGEVQGVYVPGVLALLVHQQPANKPTYVSTTDGVVTQFQLAAAQGVTGLLADNYHAGAQFFNLALAQEVRIVYGDGAVKRYIVSAIYRYQALDPNNPRSDFVDLSKGVKVSAIDLFNAVYTGSDHVIFQTCITKDGNARWGRIFVVATPTR